MKTGRNALTLETASDQGLRLFAQVTARVGERTHNPPLKPRGEVQVDQMASLPGLTSAQRPRREPPV